MKRTYSLMLVGVLALAPVARASDRVVTTDTPTGPNSLQAAIDALQDGDRITFNISPGTPSVVHYIEVPPDGFHLITKNNITIDGYTQPGATYNTASIHAANNAALKIVLINTNGNALSMYTAATNSWGADIPRFGYSDTEQAVLGFFHATNATVRGLCFICDPLTGTTQAPLEPAHDIGADETPNCKAICFAANSPENGGNYCKNFCVKGCWIGLDPVTKVVPTFYEPWYLFTDMPALPVTSIASYRTLNATGPDSNVTFNSGTIGVPVGSTNAQADFNIIMTDYGFDAEGNDYRFCGNFWNVLPNGVTAVDTYGLVPGQLQGDGYIEIGRSTCNILVGTDGDGVNDDQEGNIFAPLPTGGICIDIYGGTRTNIVVAGNYFGLDINGAPFVGIGNNVEPLVGDDGLSTVSTFRFGSDFNGVSDAAEANRATNATLFVMETPTSPSFTNGWVSMRRNSLGGCASSGNGAPPMGNGNTEGQNIYAGFIDISGGAANIIPAIGPTTTTTSLQGVCGHAVAGSPYTNLVVDLYEAADPAVNPNPQGKRWIATFTDNSAADSNPAVGAFTFNTTGLGITSAMKLTLTVTYASYTRPTIASVARSGSQSTVTISNPSLGNNGVQKSTSLSPTSFSGAGAAAGSTVSFTDTSNPTSFYRAAAPTGMGQTSPFSAVFTVP
jgi:hypothetical protein